MVQNFSLTGRWQWHYHVVAICGHGHPDTPPHESLCIRCLIGIICFYLIFYVRYYSFKLIVISSTARPQKSRGQPVLGTPPSPNWGGGTRPKGPCGSGVVIAIVTGVVSNQGQLCLTFSHTKRSCAAQTARCVGSFVLWAGKQTRVCKAENLNCFKITSLSYKCSHSDGGILHCQTDNSRCLGHKHLG